jgi:hypothetical protein
MIAGIFLCEVFKPVSDLERGSRNVRGLGTASLIGRDTRRGWSCVIDGYSIQRERSGAAAPLECRDVKDVITKRQRLDVVYRGALAGGRGGPITSSDDILFVECG